MQYQVITQSGPGQSQKPDRDTQRERSAKHTRDLLVTHHLVYEQVAGPEEQTRVNTKRRTDKATRQRPHKRQCKDQKKATAALRKQLLEAGCVSLDRVDRADLPEGYPLYREPTRSRAHNQTQINGTGIIREGQDPIDLFFMKMPRSEYRPMATVTELDQKGLNSNFFPRVKPQPQAPAPLPAPIQDPILSQAAILQATQNVITKIAREDQLHSESIARLMASLEMPSSEADQGRTSYGYVTLFRTVGKNTVPTFLSHRMNSIANMN